MIPPPKFDERTSADVCRAVQKLLPRYIDGWPEESSLAGATGAVIGVFGRFCEVIIERLNRVPEKNLLAFLDLLGFSPLPPQPARVPITFSLAPQSPGDTLVPALTQVAAAPRKGKQEPTIFETQSALTVTSARLESLLSKDPRTDRYADYSSILMMPGAAAVDPFAGAVPIDHFLYIGHEMFARSPALKRVTLSFTLEPTGREPIEPRALLWEVWDGHGVPLSPVLEAAETPTIVAGDVTFRNPPAFQAIMVQGQSMGWLRCRCLTPIVKGASNTPGAVSETQLPVVKSLTIRMEAGREGILPDRAFRNNVPVDVTKDFLPFGEKPKVGDTLYLSFPEPFSMDSARVILHIKLTPPAAEAAGEAATPTVRPRAPKLRWEYWDGQEWKTLGDSERTGRVRIVGEVREARPGEFSDSTQALTADGDVTFSLSTPVPESSLNGQKGRWVRGRIISGGYGEEARMERDATRGYVFVPATFSPPSISSVKADYVIDTTLSPASIVKHNDFSYTGVPSGEPFRLFDPVKEDRPSLYLGFSVPQGQNFSGRPVSLYFGTQPGAQIRLAAERSSSTAEGLAWAYWDGKLWASLAVRDHTAAFAHSGLVQFVAPMEATASEEFGRLRYWLRVTQKNEHPETRLLGSVLPNTTLATQTLTIATEILGSSNGKPRQTFLTVRHPILAGQQLQVRELAVSTEEERARIECEEGSDAICPVPGPEFAGEEVWVRWHEVPDFYASGPRARHYVVDREIGEIRFGDGVNGSIPPALPKNIRMQSYRTGGGAAGNKPAISIAQMRTSIPYVQSAINFEAAGGGADAESVSELINRATRGIRHRERAVTAEDYEDLARLASRQVARVKCVPLYDLSRDPDARQRRPGTVSLIIVPSSPDTRPLPGLELLECVRSFLDERRPLAADLVLVGPEYIPIDLTADIALIPDAEPGAVKLAITEAVKSFLHPLTGCMDGTGWDFGRLPQESDVYTLMHEIAGVDHVSTVVLKRMPERPGIEPSRWFLVCPGECSVSLVV